MAGGPALQDAFLAECQSKGTTVTVTLTNGGELRGAVKGFDPFTLLVEADQRVHLVYKHAISTVSPAPSGKP
jgi:host factor-I protein